MAYSTDQSTALDKMWNNRAVGGTFSHKITFDTSGTNLAAALHKVTQVPAGAFVEGVVIDCQTAEGATATIDVGLHSDADTAVDIDGFIDGANLNSAGTATSTGQAATTEEFASGRFFPVALDLTITVNNALDAAVFDMYIHGKYLDMSQSFEVG